jgi:hypothetical protein
MDPIQKGIEGQMNAMADVLAEHFPGLGFAVFIFDFGEAGRFNYISNADRLDMIVALKEFQAVLEGRKMEPPETRQ